MSLDFNNIQDDEFDNSKLDCWALCRRLYYYEHVLKIEPTAINTDIAFGQAIHDAQKVYWTEQRDDIEQAAKHAIEIFLEQCADIPPKGAKTISVGVELLNEFYNTNRITGRVITVEKRVWRTMAKGKLKYFGTSDLVVRSKQDSIVGYDWKSTALLMGNTFTRWGSICPQFIGYQWLMECEKFWVVCFHCIQDNKKQRIHYIPCYYTEKQVEMWRVGAELDMNEIYNKVRIARDMIGNGVKGYMLDGLFPTRGPKCMFWNCAYLELCCKGEALHELYVPENEFRYKGVV
jgi:hypothetical protein